jgi:hypothetical protein
MEHLTYEAIRRDPALLHELLRDARRERAETVGRLISGALRALFSRSRRPATGLAVRTSARG